jgi:hypothetical protein
VTRLRPNAGLALAVSLLVGGAARADEPPPLPPIASPTADPAAQATDPAALAERLAAVEKDVALIQRKLRMLGAENEADALGAELLSSPRWLYEAALQQDATVEGVERAYRYLALIRQLHPESPEAREAFVPAARFHRFLYRAHRVRDLHSSWIVTEPIFMIHWVSSFFEPGVFPEEELDVLMWKMPMSFYRQLEGYAKTHPEMRKWRLEVEEDNGVVEKIVGVPADAPPDRDAE